VDKKGTRGKQSKHNEKRKVTNIKKIISIILLFIILSVLIAVFILLNNLEKVNYEEDIANNINQMEDMNLVNETNEEKTPEIVEIDIPEKLEGYDVAGQLVIEKINLEKYVLKTTTDKSLKVSITRYYGAQLNNIGNCCIVGHNSKTQFNKLKKLSVDDTFYIIDREKSEKVTYKIYDICTIKPTNLDCLNQDTNGKREVTLITCNPRRVN